MTEKLQNPREFEISSLDRLDPDSVQSVLYSTHRRAFSDYVLPPGAGEAASFSAEDFAELLERRGADLSHSFGAFRSDELVGFVVNAIDSKRRRAYDVVTGVVPEHRRCGIGEALMKRSAEHLAATGCQTYQLEVLENNPKARTMYAGVGFQDRRQLLGFGVSEIPSSSASIGDVSWEPLHIENLSTAMSWLGYQPSWQNGFETISRATNNDPALQGFQSNQLVAVGIVHAKTGDVPLLAVNPNARRQGIGTHLMHALRQRTQAERLRFANLPAGEAELGIDWLHATGAKKLWAQRELHLTL